MCKVKIGEQIVSKSDLQNLVTSSILREKIPYSIMSMSSKIEQDCKGSILCISRNEIEKLVNDTTLSLLRCEYLDSYENKYYLKSTILNILVD